MRGGGGAGDLLDYGSRVGISLCLSCGKANLYLSFINLSCGGVDGPGVVVVGAWCYPLQCLCGDFSSLVSDCPSHPCAVSQPEACVSMEAVADSHTVTVSMDSSEISMIIDSIKKECLGSGAGSTAGSSKDHCMDGKEDLDLAEKMDIAVSYTGEELDFDTVGNIIAIIEDKVNGESRMAVPFAPHSVGLISNDCCSSL